MRRPIPVPDATAVVADARGPMPGRGRPTMARLRPALRWAIGLSLLAVIVSWLDAGSVAGRLGRADPALAGAAIAGLVAIHLVAAASWRRLVDRLAGVRLGWRAAVRLHYAAQAVGSITPANLGADVFRVAAVEGGAGRAQLAVPVAVQRVASVVALALLGAAGVIALSIDRPAPAWVPALAVGTAAGAGIGVVAAIVAGRRGRGSRFVRRPGQDPRAWPGRAWIGAAVRDGVGLMLVVHAAGVVLGALLVAAIEPASLARPQEVLAALAVARLAIAIPITPSGIGLQEGALALLFVHVGLPGEVAVAAALLNRTALLLTAAVGSIALLAGSRPSPGVAVVARGPVPMTDVRRPT